MLLNRISPHGGDIYNSIAELDFSINTNPLGMPPEVRDAIISAVDLCAFYPDPYCRALRESISSCEGVPCGDILCGNGAAELIYSYALALHDDRPALIISPTFSEYRSALNAAGIAAEDYILSCDNGFALTDDILNADLSRYSAVFLCTPNNPTGRIVEPDILLSIARTGVRLFADMCFLELSGLGDIYDIPRLISAYPNVAVLKAFTKSCAIPGLRLGYLMCSDRDFLESMSTKTQCWNVSTLAQTAGCAALRCRDTLTRAAELIAGEREYMSRELSSLGFTVFPSSANYILIYNDRDLYRELLARRILIRDCSDYVGLDKGFYRLAVRTRDENDRLIAAINEVIS